MSLNIIVFLVTSLQDASNNNTEHWWLHIQICFVVIGGKNYQRRKSDDKNSFRGEKQNRIWDTGYVPTTITGTLQKKFRISKSILFLVCSLRRHLHILDCFQRLLQSECWNQNTVFSTSHNAFFHHSLTTRTLFLDRHKTEWTQNCLSVISSPQSEFRRRRGHRGWA